MSIIILIALESMSIITSIALPRARTLIPFNSTSGRPQPPYLFFKRVRFLIEPLLFGSGGLRAAQFFKSFADREFGCLSHGRSIPDTKTRKALRFGYLAAPEFI
jgi:hypothetical protein